MMSGRVLPFAKRRMIGPFIFFDHMGPIDFAPGIPRSVDVRPHPHIGLSTITYLFAGEIMHRDSVGSEQPIRPGEVNWMTAGRGITHSERFEHARRFGGHMDGIQAWVALPEANEEDAPSFAHHDTASLPALEDGGARARVIAGRAYGLASPAVQNAGTDAGVTVQTLHSRFGTKEAIFIAAFQRWMAEQGQRRVHARVGDVEDVVRVLYDNYDDQGDIGLRIIAQEDRIAAIRTYTDQGRRWQRRWVADVT